MSGDSGNVCNIITLIQWGEESFSNHLGVLCQIHALKFKDNFEIQ